MSITKLQPLRKTDLNAVFITLTLTLALSYLHGSWPTSDFHGSFHQLPWKKMEVVMVVDESTE